MTAAALLRVLLLICLASLIPLGSAPSQEKESPGFLDVAITRDEIYSYQNLRFKGDYTSFESPSGHLALGRTVKGVTIVIVLGGGSVTIEGPEEHREKLRTVFGMYPLKTTFKTLYMRLHPQEFEELYGDFPLSKTQNELAFEGAQELFDQKFLASYHAGPKAILPPAKTRVLEFDTEAFGQITNEEGYWLILRRLMPYASIYPSRFVNPKQK